MAELHTRGVRDGFTLAYEQLGRGHDPILERVMTERAVTHDGSVYRGDDWTRSALYRACGGPWQVHHYLCAPLLDGDAVIGTLNLGRRSAAHPFTARDIAGVRAVAAAIAAKLQALADDLDDLVDCPRTGRACGSRRRRCRRADRRSPTPRRRRCGTRSSRAT